MLSLGVKYSMRD